MVREPGQGQVDAAAAYGQQRVAGQPVAKKEARLAGGRRGGSGHRGRPPLPPRRRRLTCKAREIAGAAKHDRECEQRRQRQRCQPNGPQLAGEQRKQMQRAAAEATMDPVERGEVASPRERPEQQRTAATGKAGEPEPRVAARADERRQCRRGGCREGAERDGEEDERDGVEFDAAVRPGDGRAGCSLRKEVRARRVGEDVDVAPRNLGGERAHRWQE